MITKTTVKSSNYVNKEMYGYAIVKVDKDKDTFKVYSGNVLNKWTEFDSGNAKIYKSKNEAKAQLEKLLSCEDNLLFLVTLGVKN